MENIKEKIEEIVKKIKDDDNFSKKFKEEPIKALEEVFGINLPDDKINEVIATIKTKIKLDDNKIINKVKGLFD